jgi:hypothetical protein
MVLNLISRHREERVLRAICLGLAVFKTRGTLEEPRRTKSRRADGKQARATRR